MGEPRNIGKELDAITFNLAQARITEHNTKQAWLTEEAKARAKLRAVDDSDGVRRSCTDVAGDIIIARNDPEHPVGKAWLAYNAARARRIKLQADEEVWTRAHWVEVRNGRAGI